GTGGQGRAISAGGDSSRVSHRGLYRRGSARSDSGQSVAVGTGSGCDFLFQARGAGFGLRETAGFVPDFSAHATGEKIRRAFSTLSLRKSLLLNQIQA